MGDTAKPRMKLEPSNMAARWPCSLCGCPTYRTHYWICLEDEATGERLTEPICEGCVQAGPEGAAERARNYAERLRERVDLLEYSAVLVDAVPSDAWLTLDEVRQRAAAWERE